MTQRAPLLLFVCLFFHRPDLEQSLIQTPDFIDPNYPQNLTIIIIIIIIIIITHFLFEHTFHLEPNLKVNVFTRRPINLTNNFLSSQTRSFSNMFNTEIFGESKNSLSALRPTSTFQLQAKHALAANWTLADAELCSAKSWRD